MDNFCFVIQPFNKIYDDRYRDTYKPAIEASDLHAYRVDEDYSAKIPILTIHQKIQEAKICFADITEDNPNVWYELGYAFAVGKEVVMICNKNRETDFPFDIRHKSIIEYQTNSGKDFTDLENNITQKINAFLKDIKTTTALLESPVKEVNGLQPYEIAILAFIIGEQYTPEMFVSVYFLKDKVTKSGFNNTAFSIGLKSLKTKGFIITSEYDDNGDRYPQCQLTEMGDAFVVDNLHLFDLGQSATQIFKSKYVKPKFDDDGIPF